VAIALKLGDNRMLPRYVLFSFGNMPLGLGKMV
jgi:hypothetical protein